MNAPSRLESTADAMIRVASGCLTDSRDLIATMREVRHRDADDMRHHFAVEDVQSSNMRHDGGMARVAWALRAIDRAERGVA